jgi:energy-coupling factor transport system ATP-binding protein
MSVCSIENGTFTYLNQSQPAVEQVSFQIEPGEIVLLLGMSGCGKSTCGRMLNGLIPHFFPGTFSGAVRLGDNVTERSPIEAYVPYVGSVFQNPKTQYFNVDSTAELAFPCENMGMPQAMIRQRVAEVAERYGIQKLLGRSVFQLSGGEKQKLAFAAANVLTPPLLILDEPTSNLDGATMRQLAQLIAQTKAAGAAVVIADHRLAWIADRFDRAYRFVDGAIAQEYSRAEFSRLSQEQLHALGLRAANLDRCNARIAQLAQTQVSGAPLLRAEDLVIGYDKKHPLRTIDQIAFDAGTITGIMGENGAGKTTLIKSLCGLVRPLQGQLFWNGKKISPKELLRQAFMVMQDVNYQLFADSVEEEVLLKSTQPQLLEQVLEQLDLTALRNRHPMSLSGGQKQRVAIASAILSGKSILFLDEPTSGLDYAHMLRFFDLLKQLKAMGKCIVVITHDEEFAALFDRIICL